MKNTLFYTNDLLVTFSITAGVPPSKKNRSSFSRLSALFDLLSGFFSAAWN
jgi:hypothetical protein